MVGRTITCQPFFFFGERLYYTSTDEGIFKKKYLALDTKNNSQLNPFEGTLTRFFFFTIL